MRHSLFLFFFVGSFACLFSCKLEITDANDSDNGRQHVPTEMQTTVFRVTTEILHSEVFREEIISNGRLTSRETADLQFEGVSSTSKLVRIYVKNGDHVEAGTPIAMLDTFLVGHNFHNAKNDLQKAYLDLQDVLIGMGYMLRDSLFIPSSVMELACIRSGYNSARSQYVLAEYNLKRATLRSPIAGIVTDLFAKPYSMIDFSSPFCRIIDNRKLEVNFTVLEDELPRVSLGSHVYIQPYALPGLNATGQVVDINASVGKDGTVHIRANIDVTPALMDGMNVRVSIIKDTEAQLVIPKTAVVQRAGRSVVFAYTSDNKAAWHYVTIGRENSSQYAITSETLQIGEEIITSGNEQLSDGSPVLRVP